ncbi:MAG: helix-turn-helix domain-containing protein [Saprospiraceae bacterium]|nr:helix-turn-helix domain-containing protein [Saprospiraceae bacterium]
MSTLSKLYTLMDVADYLHCSDTTIYRYVKDKRISYIRRGRLLLFKEEDIQDFIEKSMIKSNSF